MKIFLTGASGFIGGSVAARLVEAGHEVRGLVRDPAKVAAVSATGVIPVMGTLNDHDVLTREAQAADAVVNAASSDDRAAIGTIVAALAGSGKALIHTSGTSIVGDEAMGEPSGNIYDENSKLSPEPDKLARVALDRFVLDAPGIRSMVLCNSLIYGNALGAPAHSVQLPRLVAQARESGIARYIGRGLNIWSTVHIADVAELYLLALEKAPAGTFAYVENGESSFIDMVSAIADRLGLGAAQSWPAEDAIAKWGREIAVFGLGSNSRVRGKNARALGWSPKHGSAVEWLRHELPV
ncbi:MAG: NAD-dependent epimerase/dehydratase family protein [Parvibaculaceae bacterium]|nr:NAD-dependent epimerase/dehydratase family protein [Parvibaculaceae bacterium]